MEYDTSDWPLRLIVGGEASGICSDHEFRTRMPGAEEWRGFPWRESGSSIGYPLRVFWYPKTHNSDRASSPGTSSVFTSRISAASRRGGSSKARSIEDKIKSLLLFFHSYDDDVLVQFWAPVARDDDQIALSVSGQPFGFTKLYNGLVEFRCSCILLENLVDNISQLGPIGRVFNRGSEEYTKDIDKYYSPEEFPQKNNAINCGIRSYRALPLFEPDCYSRSCAGVLEILSLTKYFYFPICPLAENKDFTQARPHCKECQKFHRRLIFPQFHAGKYLLLDTRDECARVWVPCICDSSPGAFSEYHDDPYISSYSPTRITHLFHQSPFFYWEKHFQFDFQAINCRFENDKTWVGRAYILDKLCFSRNSTDFTVSRFFKPDCQIAVPLKLIHSKLPPLLLQVLIRYDSEKEKQAWKNPEAQFKSLLLAWAQKMSEYDHVAYGLKQSEEFCVEFSSHADGGNCIYFDVHRRDITMNNGETAGNGRPHGSPNLRNNVQHSQVDSASGQKECSVLIENSNPQDRGESSNEFSTNAGAEIILHAIENGQFHVADENFGGNQLQNHEYLEGERGQPTPPLLIQQPTVEEASVHPTTQGVAKILNGIKIDLTLDMIKQYFGRDLADAAEGLGVSRSTVKRRLRHFGIERWPSHKRNKANGVRPVSISLEVGGEFIQESEIECHPNNGETERRAESTDSIPTNAKGQSTAQECHENDDSYTMFVKAIYNGDIAKFKFLSDSGIEKLRGELDKRFKLEEFKFKYEDEDGEWITIFCDEDLQLYMENLKAAGNPVMRLSVFTVT